jgi:hypothetical protein
MYEASHQAEAAERQVITTGLEAGLRKERLMEQFEPVIVSFCCTY